MMVLGELGGIYGAIVSIPSFFISYFVQNLFMSAVTDRMPAKQKSSTYQENPIKEKLAKKDHESQCEGKLVLDAPEIQNLEFEAKKIQERPKLTLSKRVFSCLMKKSEQRTR